MCHVLSRRVRLLRGLGSTFLLVCAVAVRLGALAAVGLRSELSTKADSQGLFETRVVTELPTEIGSIRLGIVEVGCGPIPGRLEPFLATPLLTVGPLDPGGLLVEIENPVSRAAASSAYFERARLALDTSFDGSSRHGLVISPLPGVLDLFFVQRGEESARIGLTARAVLRDVASATLSVSGCRAPTSVRTDDWFTDGAPQSVPGVLHAATECHARLGALGVGTVGCLSLSRFRPAGAYGRLTLDGGLGWLRCTVTGAGVTPAYLLPDATLPSYVASGGAELSLRTAHGELNGSYLLRLARPAALGGPFRGSEQSGRGAVRVGTDSIAIAAALSRSLAVDTSGRELLEQSFDFSGYLRGGPLRLELYSSFAASNQGGVQRAFGAALLAAAKRPRPTVAPLSCGLDVRCEQKERTGSGAFDTLVAEAQLAIPVGQGLISVAAEMNRPLGGEAAAADSSANRVSVGWTVRHGPG